MYYFVGIKGTGMSALAQILKDLGYNVSGSDKTDHFFTEDVLVEKGITIYPFDANNIKEGMIIIKGNAFKDDHEEIVRAKELGLKIMTYQECLSALTKKFKTVCISGCHGKTTTTAMLSHVIEWSKGCNYLIGDGTGKARKNNEFFILESCEYKRHFLSYYPYYAVITNIELDHIDYYKDIDDYVGAFEEFANNAQKAIIAWGEDPWTRKLKVNKPIYFYGLEDNDDIIAKNVNYTNDGTTFDCYIKGDLFGHFELPLYGKHMLLNSLAVITICYLENVSYEDVFKHLKTFKGAKRRFKEKVLGEIVTIDDYAHHPTEVAVTIKGARQKYPNKEIVAILKTHTLSRTKEMQQEFAEALNLADKSYIMDVGVDREEIGYDDVTYEVILNKLNNGEHIGLDSVSKLLKHKNAVIIFMSSKDIYKLQDKYEELITK